MKTNAKPTFENIPDVGDLTSLHTVLIEAEDPLLFVCEDTDANTYIVFRGDEDTYAIAKATRTTLRKVLNKELAIRKAFSQSKCVILAKKKDGILTFTKTSVTKLPQSLLPKEREKLERADFVGLAMWPAEKKKKKKT